MSNKESYRLYFIVYFHTTPRDTKCLESDYFTQYNAVFIASQFAMITVNTLLVGGCVYSTVPNTPYVIENTVETTYSVRGRLRLVC